MIGTEVSSISQTASYLDVDTLCDGAKRFLFT